jgi:hypothetical protein
MFGGRHIISSVESGKASEVSDDYPSQIPLREFGGVHRLLVTASVFPISPDSYPDEGGAKFLRNTGVYKSHTA